MLCGKIKDISISTAKHNVINLGKISVQFYVDFFSLIFVTSDRIVG